MKISKFKQKLIKAIEETEEFVVHDNEKDSDFNLPDIKDKLNHIVVAGENEKEIFCISIIKV